jgi:hypothetical protein
VSGSIHAAPAVCPQLESWRVCSSGKEIAADDGKVTDMQDKERSPEPTSLEQRVSSVTDGPAFLGQQS